MSYPSPICEYCECTEYGTRDIDTNQFNMCEGVECEQALETYNNEHESEDRFVSVEDAF